MIDSMHIKYPLHYQFNGCARWCGIIASIAVGVVVVHDITPSQSCESFFGKSVCRGILLLACIMSQWEGGRDSYSLV